MKMNQGVKGEGVAKTVAHACIASCQKLAAQIERTKGNLLAEFREQFQVPEQLFRQALGEAEALAWQTGYPQLVFPALAMEKVQAVATWQRRQQSLVPGRRPTRLAV
jgi:hypothetical protein